MVLARSTHKMAGMDSRFPRLVPEPSKQTLVGKLGGVQRMCEALRQFPKKRETVLAFTIAGLAHVIRCHEDNQRLLDKHKGVELLTASMTKWSEDKRHVFLILYTLRVRDLRRRACLPSPAELHRMVLTDRTRVGAS
jgi:hypothetical protein